MPYRHLIVALVAACGSTGSMALAAPPSAPFDLEMDGGIVLPVRVNGDRPVAFRLDTGASRTVLTAGLAARLHLPDGPAERVVTQAGEVAGSLARVRLGFGCVEVEVEAVVLPDRAVDARGQILGLVGLDALAGRVFTLDYEEKRLSCAESRPPGPRSVRLPLEVRGGRALVSIAGKNNVALDLVPDSGADRLVLFDRAPALRDWLGVTPIGPVRIRSVASTALARRVLVHGLERLVPQAPVEGLLLRGAGREMGDGLLPLSLFARVTFDLPGGAVVAEVRGSAGASAGIGRGHDGQ